MTQRLDTGVLKIGTLRVHWHVYDNSYAACRYWFRVSSGVQLHDVSIER